MRIIVETESKIAKAAVTAWLVLGALILGLAVPVVGAVLLADLIKGVI